MEQGFCLVGFGLVRLGSASFRPWFLFRLFICGQPLGFGNRFIIYGLEGKNYTPQPQMQILIYLLYLRLEVLAYI